MLQQAISVSLLSAMAATTPVASQGIRGTITGAPAYVAPATRVLVATPYPSSSSDSMVAVAIGNAVRDKLNGKIGGSDWLVIPRREMNENLSKWGYTADQLFAPESARQMATAMSARMFVMTTVSKGPSGLFTASIRVTGIADDAGHVVKATQVQGQSPVDFGGKIAEQVTIVFKAYTDAKSCTDNLAANKAKAVEGANKALKTIPGYGLPEYCLGLIEQAKDSVGAETLRHFTAAANDDSLSLRAISQISIIHQKKHDSTAVVNDFQRMITVNPTNRLLIDEAVKIFKQYGRPDAADQVVAAQIKLDPTSADWPELQGRSCAAAGATESDPAKAKVKFTCAYNAFVQVATLDPTRADTNFYPMIVFVSGNRADSLTWLKKWIDKYPSATDPYKAELSLYMDAGQTDSALKIVNMLNAIDPTDARPTLAIEQAFLKAKRYDDAIKLAPYFTKYGDETAKNQFAGLLVQQGQAIIADTADKSEAKDSTLAHMGRAIAATKPSTPVYMEMGNYFVVMSYVPTFTRLSTAVRAEKSCDTANKYEAFLTSMLGDPALKDLGTASTASLVDFSGKLTASVQAELTGAQGVPAMKKVFCKG